MNQTCFQGIVKCFILLLSNYNENLPFKEQSKFQELISMIKKIQENFQLLKSIKKRQSGIGIKNIFIKNGLRLSLYYLPKGQTMKLHNHAGMFVLTYFVEGKIQAKMYTPVDQEGLCSRQTVQYCKGDISIIDGAASNENNLHQLSSKQHTTFLDIIFPDYNQTNDCLFFQQQEIIGDNLFKLKIVKEQQGQIYQL